MKSRIWQLAGVGLLCVSVSAQTLAEGQGQEQRQQEQQQQQRGNQHGQEHGGQPQNHPQPQQPPQQQPQQRPQQSGQYQFHQQNFNREEGAARPQNAQPQFHQQQNTPTQFHQEQQRAPQQSGQYQFHQEPREQQAEQPSIRPRPDEVRQTQQPIRGNYADMPNRDRHDDHRWPGRPDGHGNGWGPGPQYRPGQYVDRFPGQSYRVPYRGGDYFFSGGYWYRPDGPRYVVVSPPYGIRTRYLPDYASEVWVGGALFFLAAGSYYQWMDDSQDYVVVNPPVAQEQPQPEPQPAADPYDVAVYPAYGQGPQQIQQDKYDCYRTAVQQTGFDPANATYAPDPAVVYSYRNAMASCLSTRGYRVN
ncbi:DUF6515 family protein [Pseudomonas sp.]|uniref:DUF6515 family protein n=1 Tax=Pseudomonas sp. TaxID=306 RepID=UPI003CC6769A